jgi:hypothetical protein
MRNKGEKAEAIPFAGENRIFSPVFFNHESAKKRKRSRPLFYFVLLSFRVFVVLMIHLKA